MTEEAFFTCPYCREMISILVDLSEDGPSEYVEDCEVCCNPIQVSYVIEENALTGFRGNRLD